MNIKVAKQEISNCIKAYLTKNEKGDYIIPTVRQRPILLMGPPGIGKTAIMEQVASENNIALVSYTITHHTRESAVGAPQVVTMHYNKESFPVTTYTMSEIIAEVYRKMNITNLKEGILFLDEINCVDESLLPAILQFLQFKTFGTHKVPEGWIIAVAGNPVEYNQSVKEFDVVTLDRLKRMEIEPDFTVWREYAYKSRINSAIISYLFNRSDKFYVVKNTSENKMFVTARGWEDMSDMLNAYENLKLEITVDFVQQYIQHPDIAQDFIEYYYRYIRCVNENRFSDIITGENKEELKSNISKLDLEMRNAFMIYVVHALAEVFYECEYQKYYAKNVVEMAEEVGKLYEKSRLNYRSDTYSVTEGMRQMLAKQVETNFMSHNEIAAIRNAIKFVDDIALKYATGTEEMLFIAEIYREIQMEFEPIDTNYQIFLEKTRNVLKNVYEFVKENISGEEFDRYVKEFSFNCHITDFIRNESTEEYLELINGKIE